MADKLSAIFFSGEVMENWIYYLIGALLLIIVITLIFIRRKRTGVQVPVKPLTLSAKLSKTRSNLIGRIFDTITSRSSIDAELVEELEEVMLQADIGVKATLDITEELKQKIQTDKISDPVIIKQELQDIITQLLVSDYSQAGDHFQIKAIQPFVILFAGVNGVGKTTTIGKLAKRFADQGKSVLVIAADTFRAAAVEQLAIWAERAGADIIKQESGADPSAVVYDGLVSAVNKKKDIVLIDTAGRQHTKINLMNELGKINRTIKKVVADGPHETLMVIDATTGQNAITQVETFNRSLDLSGLVLTKLDGTAKGGIVIGIKHQLNIPVKLIGVGEAVEDLRDFDEKEFIKAIFS
jgi:fused signal recognition particle receptor